MQDSASVIEYIKRFNGWPKFFDQEQRVIRAGFRPKDFRAAFLADKPEAIFNKDQTIFHYDPNNYANSYLETNGSEGQSVAEAILGINIYESDATNDYRSSNASSQSNGNDASPANEIISGKEGITYYPKELAEIYGFPDHARTNGGDGVTIGLIGSGGNRFESVLNKNNAFNKYLRAQGIDLKTLGHLKSPNSPDELSNPMWYTESAMDYSILRSIAPRSNLVVTANEDLYDQYAELIYDPEIDIISSSLSVPVSLNSYATDRDSFHELFLDALLRGKPVVVASGDNGTANNTRLVPTGSAIPNMTEGDASILSVGGTAFAKKTKRYSQERPAIMNPTKFPKRLGSESIDAITGLVDSQYVWNQATT